MALEALLYAPRTPVGGTALAAFAADVDVTLRALARALRQPAQPLARLPNLRGDLSALTGDLAAETVRSDVATDRRLWPAAFLAEAERIVDSLDALAQLVCRWERVGVA